MENPDLYENLLLDAGDASTAEIIAFFKSELPWLWADHYRGYCDPFGDICIVQIGDFQYIMDDRSIVGYEPRIISAFGVSLANSKKRDGFNGGQCFYFVNNSYNFRLK